LIAHLGIPISSKRALLGMDPSSESKISKK